MIARATGTTRIETIAVAVAAAGTGALVAVRPAAAGGVVVAVALVLVAARDGRLRTAFAAAAATLLTGYVFLDRGFAHLGRPPVYVGDAVLGLGAVLLLTRARPVMRPLHWLLVAFMAWGLLRTLPFLGTDGIDAVRDGALWIYGLYALAVAAVLDERTIGRAVAGYGRLVVPIVLWMPVGLVATHELASTAGAGVPLLQLKGGDAGVHLAGAAAFVLLGLSRRRVHEALFWPLWIVAAAFAGSGNRGALLTMALALVVAVALAGSSRRRLLLVGASTASIVLVVLFNPSVGIWGHRPVSAAQLEANVLSITSARGNPYLDGTRSFRLRWWRSIVDYTFTGPYFWTGKGFGVNLADSDGFQVTADHSLRAPHNSHVTVLARMGVPGLALWLALQAAFGAALLGARRRALRAGRSRWARLDAWLFVYWLAMLVNTSFDPFLEGPQGGIWFWSVFGAGLAVLELQRRSAAPEEVPA